MYKEKDERMGEKRGRERHRDGGREREGRREDKNSEETRRITARRERESGHRERTNTLYGDVLCSRLCTGATAAED